MAVVGRPGRPRSTVFWSLFSSSLSSRSIHLQLPKEKEEKPGSRFERRRSNGDGKRERERGEGNVVSSLLVFCCTHKAFFLIN